MRVHSMRTAHQGATLAAELRGSVPRDVLLTGGGVAVVIVAAALAVGALAGTIGMSIVYARSEDRRHLREREAVAVEADVANVSVRRGEQPRRTVTYRFEAGGRTYAGRASLRRSDRRHVERGGRVSVSYVASSPEMNWLTGYEPRGFPGWLIPIVPVVLLASAAATARPVRRQWVLLSEGRLAEARVTGHKKYQDDKSTTYRVFCEFRDLSGAQRLAKYSTGKTPPPLNTMVPIMYHRDNPAWTARYPLPFVRARRSGRRGEAPGDRMQ